MNDEERSNRLNQFAVQIASELGMDGVIIIANTQQKILPGFGEPPPPRIFNSTYGNFERPLFALRILNGSIGILLDQLWQRAVGIERQMQQQQ